MNVNCYHIIFSRIFTGHCKLFKMKPYNCRREKYWDRTIFFVFTHNTLCSSSPEINSEGEEMKGTQVETRTASFLPILRSCPIRTEIFGTLALLLAWNDLIMCNDVVYVLIPYKDMFDKLYGLLSLRKFRSICKTVVVVTELCITIMW